MTDPSIEIRRATASDEPAIDRFAHAVVHDTYDRLVDVDYANGLLNDWWGQALHDDVVSGSVYIAVVNLDVVGLAHVGDRNHEPVLWKLYVADALRGNGIGPALIANVLAALPASTPRLWTEHIAANLDAERFYVREGFARTSVDEDTEDPRTWTVWRAKDLPTADDESWAAFVEHMDRVAIVEQGRDEQIAHWLAAEPTTRIADFGCGTGAMTVQLAQASPMAQVLAYDGSSAMVDATRLRLEDGHLSHRISVEQRDLAVDLGSLEPFDLIWASHVVHHLPDQIAMLDSMRRCLRTGGRLALAEGGLPSRTLPWDLGIGEPGLELRLDVAREATFRNLRRNLAGGVRAPGSWPTLLRSAGFSDVSSQTFLVDVPEPLDTSTRSMIIEQLRFGLKHLEPAGLLSAEDTATLTVLLDPESPHFLGNRNDMHYLSAITVHVART